MTRTFQPLTYSENAIDERAITQKLGARVVRLSFDSAQPVLEVTRENLLSVVGTLKSDPELAYNFFTDLTCADLSEKPSFDTEKRFQVIIILYSLTHKRRIRLRVFVPEDDPRCPSLTPLFAGADLTERKAHEMFGVKFEGHPNLIRLLTPSYMKDYPLRKEYPVTGKGERDNFPRYEEIQ